VEKGILNVFLGTYTLDMSNCSDSTHHNLNPDNIRTPWICLFVVMLLITVSIQITHTRPDYVSV